MLVCARPYRTESKIPSLLLYMWPHPPQNQRRPCFFIFSLAPSHVNHVQPLNAPKLLRLFLRCLHSSQITTSALQCQDPVCRCPYEGALQRRTKKESKVQSERSFRLRVPRVAAARLHCLRPATFGSRPWLITCLTITLTGTTPLSATDAVSLANLPEAALHAVTLVWCCGHGLVLNYTDLKKNGQTTDSVTTTPDCRDGGTLGSRPSASRIT